MRTAPVAVIQFAPAVLPVFDPSWKAKCRTCSGFSDVATGMRCTTVVPEAQDWSRKWLVYCIEAREGECGPEAKLWEKAC